MKIGIFNDDFNLGGVQTVSINLANHLSKNPDYDVNLVSVFKNKDTLMDQMDSNFVFHRLNCERKFLEKFGLKLSFSMKSKLSIEAHSQSIIIKLKQFLHRQHFDVVIVSQGILSVIMASIIKLNRCNNTKFISWQHSSYETYFYNYYRKFSEELSNSLKEFDYLVVLTESDLKKFSLINQNTVKIFNLNRDFISKTTNDLAKKNIIYTGRLDIKTKGLDNLIKAFSRLSNPDWKLTMVGDGADLQELKKLASESKAEDRILFPGMVKDNIEEYYLNSSLFVLPSRWEGFGLSLIEAMSLGLPVISTNTTGPLEILSNGEHGAIVKVDDIDGLVQVLDRFTNDHNLRKEYQQKSLNRAADFNNSNIIKTWISLLESGEQL